MKDINLMYAFAKSLATTMANESKKDIKNPELMAFVKDLESLSQRAEKIIAKSKNTYNQKEFKDFVATCAVFSLNLENVFNDYIHQDLTNSKKPKEGKKHGK